MKQKIKDGENEICNLDQQIIDLKEKKNVVRLLIVLCQVLTPAMFSVYFKNPKSASYSCQ